MSSLHVLYCSCLDASIAIKPGIERFQSVVITSGISGTYIHTYTAHTRLPLLLGSGTLSPIDLYPKLLNFNPVIRLSLPMSTFRPCLLPLLVTR